jgi:hypothetical protein
MAVKRKAKVHKQTGTVSPNAFGGQSECLTQRTLRSALGQSCPLWRKLISNLKHDFKLDGEEWNSSGVKYGMISEAKRYAAGTPVRIEVRKPEDLELVKILAKIKVEN